MSDFYSRKISEDNFKNGKYVVRILNEAGYIFNRDLKDVTVEKLFRIRGLGRKSFDELLKYIIDNKIPYRYGDEIFVGIDPIEAKEKEFNSEDFVHNKTFLFILRKGFRTKEDFVNIDLNEFSKIKGVGPMILEDVEHYLNKNNIPYTYDKGTPFKKYDRDEAFRLYDSVTRRIFKMNNVDYGETSNEYSEHINTIDHYIWEILNEFEYMKNEICK